MVQIEAAVSPDARPRGRPRVRTDRETLELVVEAAMRMFQATGYAGTGMSAVASEAGISTKTLYRLIPTKADLFHLIITDRIDRFILAIDEEAMRNLPVAAGLERLLVAYGGLTLSAETIALHRLVIAESDRFPEIAKEFYDTAIRPTAAAMAAWLQHRCDEGLIHLDDVQGAALMLRGMMVMEMQRAVMFGQRGAPDAAEIMHLAQSCAAMFLRGCSA